MLKSSIAIAVLGLTLLGFASPSQASNVTYSPAACTSYYNGAQFMNPSWVSEPSGFFPFAGGFTSSMIAVCPIVRQNILNTNGLRGLTVYVNVPSGNSVSCTVYAMDTWGNTIDSKTKTVTSAGHQQIDLSTALSSAYGTYSLQCTMPASQGSSAIFDYVVAEW